MDIIIQLLAAFLGALGYSLLFQVGKSKLFPASLGALMTQGCCIICGLFLPKEFLCFFVSSAALTLYAENMARKWKAPTTVFLVPGTIPLIPGGSLYQTMSYFLQKEWELFIKQGLNTMLLAVSISFGILTMMTITKLYYKVKSKILRKG